MINKLKEINEQLIRINNNNNKELKKYLLIKEILNQDNCFFRMSIEQSYAILRDLHIPEKDLRNVYINLIDKKEIK